MIIADCIRECLRNNPSGALTNQVAIWCLQKGCCFNTPNVNKTVSGQLSKMMSRGEVYARPGPGNQYIWTYVNRYSI